MMQIEHSTRDGMPKYTNHLSTETSPYLRKHAHNPVEWYPWGSAAFERARTEKKPIHLSVGYRSEEHTSELQSQSNLVCRLLLEKKKTTRTTYSCSVSAAE